ncbi:unnamed protein product [Spirodela intermedia]|uniref:Uncharacterized protein n=1 Tax=Spirodela intermedia TaxID=51605 RepID=A0A7I8ILD8_SPIIN|nr:unnamed protein product [Spirodela intermedia]CAA6657982.1 unnamed protein product [Spirodela intermedia]
MYSKCGGSSTAVRIFNGLRRPNEVAFTAMMGGLVKDGSMAEALLLFSNMRKKGIHVDSVAVSCVLGACTRIAAEERCFFGRQVHALVTKSAFDSDIHVGNSLVDFYAKSGDIGDAQKAFTSMHERNNVSWNILIAGYGNQGEIEKVKHLIDQMQALGFKPDEVTRASQLSACAKSGDVDSARQVFDRMPSPSLTSWNTILSIYSQREMHLEALELFKKMQQLSGVPFDRTTIAVALSACSGTGLLPFGKQIHGASTRRFLHGDLFVSSGLVDMYSKCGLIGLARQVFDRMPERDVVSWNSMIASLALHSCCREAFHLFHQMLAAGFRPTEYSYASVISSSARLSSLSQGRQLHGQTLKDGLCNDVFVGSSLIDMYAKCGGVEEARVFFDHMPSRNIVSWNEMIHGYAQNGGGGAAVELFEEMLQRGGEVRPDGVTLIAVLTGCSNSGMVDKATELLHSMERDLDLVPLADHYACAVDALARAGRFSEVRALIQKMPHEEDPIIWEVLLSACRVHGEEEMGRFAAERLFRLDPVNPSPYVLLSNIYAANGRWDQVAAIRRKMVDRGVAKNRGYSWIDDKVSVTAFMVDDDVRAVADRSG